MTGPSPAPPGSFPSASTGPAGPRPLIVNFHGGGWVVGNLRMSDWICSRVAGRVGAVVVSADYRRAPGHRFPAAVDDCYAAVLWAAENAAALGAGGPMGVMGESAGATSRRW
jgi:acetyl esterase